MQIILELHVWIGKVQNDSSFMKEYSYLTNSECINKQTLSFPPFCSLKPIEKKKKKEDAFRIWPLCAYSPTGVSELPETSNPVKGFSKPYSLATATGTVN